MTRPVTLAIVSRDLLKVTIVCTIICVLLLTHVAEAQVLLPPSQWKGGLMGQSKMDDSPSVLFTLAAENEIVGWLKTYRPHLILRCREKKIDAYIDVGMSAQPELGRHNSASVRLRFDEEKPADTVWSESTSNDTLFAPNPRLLIKQIAASKRLLFRFTPFNSSPVLVEFSIGGFSSQHLNLLASTCHWKP